MISSINQTLKKKNYCNKVAIEHGTSQLHVLCLSREKTAESKG